MLFRSSVWGPGFDTLGCTLGFDSDFVAAFDDPALGCAVGFDFKLLGCALGPGSVAFDDPAFGCALGDKFLCCVLGFGSVFAFGCALGVRVDLRVDVLGCALGFGSVAAFDDPASGFGCVLAASLPDLRGG